MTVPRTREYWLVLLAALLALIGLTVGYLSGGSLVAVDVWFNDLLVGIRNDELLGLFGVITLLGEIDLVLVAVVALSVILWRRRQGLMAAGLWISLVISEAITALGKMTIERERPSLQAIAEDSFSFPSNHATLALAFYGFVAYLLLAKFKHKRARAAVIVSLAILVLLIDFSRLYLGVHYLSDVLAGNLVGLSGLLMAILISEKFTSKR